MTENILTAQHLRDVIDYDSDTGILVWRPRNISQGRKSRRGGRAAGHINTIGYMVVGISGKEYLAHRLAFLWVNGKWPDGEADHINGNRADNRWENLRDVPHQMNIENQRQAPASNASTGLLGATLHRPTGLFMSQIKSRGVKHYLGYFKTPEEAHAAYLEAKRRLHDGCTI